MKKALLLLLLIPFNLFAQEDPGITPLADKPNFEHYKWEIGINGGVNIASVAGAIDSTSILSRAGRLYGATITYHFNKYIALKTDIDFENKGWTINDVQVQTGGTGGTSTQNVTQYLDYFDIPAFLHVGFGNRMKFDLNFGPYVAFLLDNRAFYTDPSGIEVPVTDDLFSNYSSTDFGITYGAGIDFALGKRWSMGFDFLIQKGLKEINVEGLKNTSMDFDFGINYMFGEKKKK